MGFKSKYSPEERRQALVVFASQQGRKDLVVPMLKEIGLNFNYHTLQQYAYNAYRDEYDQIKQEYDAYIRSQAVDNFRSVASLATEVSHEAMRQVKAALERGELTLKELPKAAASAMVTAGIATDKGELLSGNPTQRVAHDVDDLQRELASVGIHVVMPGQPDDSKPTIDVQTKPPALPSPGA